MKIDHTFNEESQEHLGKVLGLSEERGKELIGFVLKALKTETFVHETMKLIIEEANTMGELIFSLYSMGVIQGTHADQRKAMRDMVDELKGLGEINS